jgi:choline dehydrogenase
MQRRFLHALAVTPALAWTQPRFGYVPGNDYGIPQNASYDYVIIGGGKHNGQYAIARLF